MLRNFQPRPGTSVSNTLVICFALVCAVLAATGGFIFLNMRSLQLLDEQEAQSTAHEVDALRGVAKDADLAHAEIFHALAAATLEEKEVHVAMALRAFALSSGPTASSRSTTTLSAPLASALPNRSGRVPGTKR